jgi:hypothetical protein
VSRELKEFKVSWVLRDIKVFKEHKEEMEILVVLRFIIILITIQIIQFLPMAIWNFQILI